MPLDTSQQLHEHHHKVNPADGELQGRGKIRDHLLWRGPCGLDASTILSTLVHKTALLSGPLLPAALPGEPLSWH